MPNFWTLVWGPPEFRRFSAEIRFAEMRRGRISLLSIGWYGSVLSSLGPLHTTGVVFGHWSGVV